MSDTPDDVIPIGEVRGKGALPYGAVRPRRADKIKRNLASRRAIFHRRRG